MGEVSKGDGRTVLFVSHNMDTINKLCNKGIYLNNGKIEFVGDIENTINNYLLKKENNKAHKIYNKTIENILLIRSEIINNQNKGSNNFKVNEEWRVRITFEVINNINNYVFAIGLFTITEIPINTSWSNPTSLKKGVYSLEFFIKNLPLQSGQYSLVFGLTQNEKSLFYDDNFLSVDIENITLDERIEKADGSTGILAMQFETLIKTL